MIKIPLKDMNDSVIECELDGVVYFLRMGWNGAAQSWAFSLESANNDLLISGVRVDQYLIAAKLPSFASANRRIDGCGC